MWNIYKTVVVLAVICSFAGLLYSFKSPTAVTETLPSNAVNEIKSEPTNTIQPTSTGQDPFKKFLDEKADNANPAAKSHNFQVTPTQAAKDPFKDFLEKQKQNSKDQVVFPFGKN